MHAWTVTGTLSTFFFCTYTLDSSVTIGVEVLGSAAGAALNDVSVSSLAAAPGGTVLVGTDMSLGFSIDAGERE